METSGNFHDLPQRMDELYGVKFKGKNLGDIKGMMKKVDGAHPNMTAPVSQKMDGVDKTSATVNKKVVLTAV